MKARKGKIMRTVNELKVKVKYFDDSMTKLEINPNGDLIDVRVRSVEYYFDSQSQTTIEYSLKENGKFEYKAGDVLKLRLGIAIQLPNGYKTNLYPRSSTFKNYGWLLTNSVGQIDNAYCGNDDEILAMVYCLRDGSVEFNDRVFQLEFVPSMYKDKAIILENVECLYEANRGGYGTSGVK